MEIKNDNYINIPAHARLVYDLKGNELLLYGLIYGFTQDGENWCECGQQYMCDWIGASDTKTVRNILDRLIEIGAIEKTETYINNVKFCKYKAKSPYRGKIDPTPGVKLTDNNIDNNIPLVLSSSYEESNTSPKGMCERNAKEMFESFRKIYRGRKRGLETEFANFKKKHKDWDSVVKILFRTYNQQCALADELKAKGEFVPVPKNLQTYINQRCWEEEIDVVKEDHVYS